MEEDPGSGTAQVVACVAYAANGTRLPPIDFAQISDVLARDDGSFVWVGLHDPDEATMKQMQEEFGLHDLAVEDAHAAHQRPKVEAYGQSQFIAVKTAQAVHGHVQFGETHMFLGKRYLVTIRHGASLTHTPARNRCEREIAMMAYGPSFALYATLDFIVDNYLPVVQDFQRELDKLEKDVFAEDYRRQTLRDLYDLKQELTAMKMAVAPMQDVINQIQRLPAPLVRDEVRIYFRDVSDHVARVNEATDIMREMLTAAMSVNLAVVTVAQGETLKRMAGWGALLAVPTLMASWYGMNFQDMPELHGRYSYHILIGVATLVCVILYIGLRRIRWL
ncbi:MAG: magnesium and cobalt transport protein CorA [Proteobacteria bacterium]|nr:magnesium and cobalt transport protein CorA [Pseudomonadota bacterium]MBS0461509.1 magnesium and cobalt transport protein CorA [Pseudomonadota bacterium]